MNGEDAETVVQRLTKYIEDVKNDTGDEMIKGFKVYKNI